MDVRVIPNLGKVTSIGATTDDDILIYDATNDGNPQYRVGSADANEGHIQAVYDSGAQTLDYLLISTDSATEGDIVINQKGNLGLNGQTTFGTSADGVVAIASGTAPSTSPADAFQMWIADRGATAGKAALHWRAEDSTVGVIGDRVGIGTASPSTGWHLKGGGWSSRGLIEMSAGQSAMQFGTTGLAANTSYTIGLRVTGDIFCFSASDDLDVNRIFTFTRTGYVGFKNSSPDTLIHQAKWSADAVGTYHTLSKSRNATADTHTVVQDNDVIGGTNYCPSDGTDFGTVSAQIKAEVDDAAPAASSIGGALVFSTAAGAASDDLTERMRIAANGAVSFPSATSTIALESNTQTTGNVVSIKSTPGSASDAVVMCLEADGSNWGSGAAVLKIISDDSDAAPIRIYQSSSEIITLYRTGNIALSGDLQLTAGGSIVSTSNGNVSIVPNGTGVLYCGTGSPGHLTPTTGESYFQGKAEFDTIAYFDGGISIEANNIATDTSTGMKIGTATNQKIGFFNKTPVVQLAKASYNNWAALGDVVNALVAIGLFDAA